LRPRLYHLFALLTALLAFAGVAASAAQATTVSWKASVRIEPPSHGGISGVACPSSNLCVAVDQEGYVIVSTSPSKSKWRRPIYVDHNGGGINAISCPSIRLCIAVDNNGRVITSTNPTGGAGAWARPVRVDTSDGSDGGQAALIAVDCPSVNLCVAVDSADPADVVTSSDPTGGATAWATTQLGGTLDAVSCPYQSTFCMVAGSHEEWSEEPTSGKADWHSAGSHGGLMAGLACPSDDECVGAGYGPAAPTIISSTTAPRGTNSPWNSIAVGANPPIGGEGLLDSIACTSTKFCVAVSSDDAYWQSNAPTSGKWSASRPLRTSHGVLFSAITCRPKLCVSVDSTGIATSGIVH
jgi:hypothetical protein